MHVLKLGVDRDLDDRPLGQPIENARIPRVLDQALQIA
jgi:hypothetical protein